MANPMPRLPPPLGERIQLLMPTSSPRALMSAPPELPWLIAASVWMKSVTPPLCERLLADTMPSVTVPLS